MIDIIGAPPAAVTTMRGVRPKAPLTFAYVRVSTEKQGLSLRAQTKVIRDYAHWNGLTIDRFVAEKKSGKSLRGRPGLSRILDMAAAGMVAHVIVQDITRLFRDTREALNAFDQLESKGVRFHSAVEQGGVDPTTPDGELMRTFRLALGQHERRQLGERTRRVLRETKQAPAGTGNPAIEAKVREGKLMVGRAPYGYRWVRKTLKEHPKEYPILQKILEMRDGGMNAPRIADWLNDRRIRSKNKGLFWHRTQINRLLKAYPE